MTTERENQRRDEQRRAAYTVQEAADQAASSRTSIYEAIKAGALVARKIGRRTVILDEDLREWLASLPLMRDAA